MIFLLTIFNILNIKAQNKPSPYIALGFTNHNYFFENSWSNPNNDSYLSSIVSTPTVVLGYENKKWFSGVELSFYNSFVPTTDTLVDLGFVKNAFSLDYYFVLDAFRLGAFYSSQDSRSRLAFSSSYNRKFTFERGIGFSVGYKTDNFTFDLRKEMFFGFGEQVNYISQISEYWSLRVLRRFSLMESGDSKKKFDKGPFCMNIGAMVSQNGLKNSPFPSQGAAKFQPTFGLEYRFDDIHTSVYIRRSVWYSLEAFNYNFKTNSQVNYIGALYIYNLPNRRELKIGLHHVWTVDRSLLYLDFLEKGYHPSVLWNNYDNKGVGLDLRYTLSPQFDVVLNADCFYEVNHRLKKGFNAESLRLGILYNLY